MPGASGGRRLGRRRSVAASRCRIVGSSPAAAGRCDHGEGLARLEHGVGGAGQRLDRAVVAADAVDAEAASLAAAQAEGGDAAMTRQNREIEPFAGAQRP